MSERDNAAAIEALTQGLFAAAESMRQTSATMVEVGRKVGQLCDDLKSYIDQSDGRHRESERNIRVLETRFNDFTRRFEPVEKDFKDRQRAASR